MTDYIHYIILTSLIVYAASKFYAQIYSSSGVGSHVNLLDVNPKEPTAASSIFDFAALDIDGNITHLSKYSGFVTFIVNVASK